MPVSKTYSHAAPYIREALVRAIHKGTTFTLKRDRVQGMSQAYGLALALQIMARSEDQEPIAGIHEEKNLPRGALQATREYLKLDADMILGTTPRTVETTSDLPAAPAIPQIPRA